MDNKKGGLSPLSFYLRLIANPSELIHNIVGCVDEEARPF